jgi:hypothetical protein
MHNVVLVQILGYLGAGLGLLSYAWLTAIAFKQAIAWGIVLVLFFPLAGVFYAFFVVGDKSMGPIKLCLVGFVFSVLGLYLMDFG